MKWNIGCSGFHYKEWKDRFYPTGLPQKKWFEFYCTQFDTLEMNVTFYRFPRIELIQKWFTASPGNFKFSVKAPRLITHYKKLKDCKQLLDDFYTTIGKGLGERLGAVLFQFPPSFAYTSGNMELVAGNLNRPGFINVAEFRHTSWWNDEVYKKLGKENIVFCGINHPLLPDTPVVNTGRAYYRFHGVPDLYYSQYDHGFLQQTADKLLLQKKCREAFVYFNNTASMAAIENGLWLKKITKPE